MADKATPSDVILCEIEDRKVRRSKCLYAREKAEENNPTCPKCPNYLYLKAKQKLEESPFITFSPNTEKAFAAFERWEVPRKAWNEPEGFLDNVSQENGNREAWDRFKVILEDAVIQKNRLSVREGCAPAEVSQPVYVKEEVKSILCRIVALYGFHVGYYAAQVKAKQEEAAEITKTNKALRIIKRQRIRDLRKFGKHVPKPIIDWSKIDPGRIPKRLERTVDPREGGRPREKGVIALIGEMRETIGHLPFKGISGSPTIEQVISLFLEGLLSKTLPPATVRDYFNR